MSEVKLKRRSAEQRYKKALEQIAGAAEIKPEMRDYANIGRNAIVTAQKALYEPCPRCGK